MQGGGVGNRESGDELQEPDTQKRERRRWLKGRQEDKERMRERGTLEQGSVR